MTRNEIEFVRNVYEECCIKGLLVPESLREAFWLITGTREIRPVVGPRECKQTIMAYWQRQTKEFLAGFEQAIAITPEQELEDLEDRFMDLQTQWENGLDLSPNERRSISMKLLHIEKRIEKMYNQLNIPIGDEDDLQDTDSTETVLPTDSVTLSTSNANQSHSEAVNYVGIGVEDKRALDATLDPPENIMDVLGTLRDKPETELPEKRELDTNHEISQLEAQYLVALTPAAKRKITLAIKALKQQ